MDYQHRISQGVFGIHVDLGCSDGQLDQSIGVGHVPEVDQTAEQIVSWGLFHQQVGWSDVVVDELEGVLGEPGDYFIELI